MTAPIDGAALVAAGRWAVEPGVAGFAVRDKLVTTVRGTLPVGDGGVTVGEAGEVVHGWVRLAVGGIATGNARRDRDLMKPGLLDGGRFPVVSLSASGGSVAAASGAGSVLEGTVLAKGVRVPVTLTATVVGDDGPDVVRVRVTGRLDRRPLGIRAPSFVIGRWVDLEAELTLRRVAGDAS